MFIPGCVPQYPCFTKLTADVYIIHCEHTCICRKETSDCKHKKTYHPFRVNRHSVTQEILQYFKFSLSCHYITQWWHGWSVCLSYNVCILLVFVIRSTGIVCGIFSSTKRVFWLWLGALHTGLITMYWGRVHGHCQILTSMFISHSCGSSPVFNSSVLFTVAFSFQNIFLFAIWKWNIRKLHCQK